MARAAYGDLHVRGGRSGVVALTLRHLAAAVVVTAACTRSPQPVAHLLPVDAFVVPLPAGFRAPEVPAENPISDARVELGRHLFYDTRLSANGTQSCASCHQQRLAFTDGRAHALGSTGREHFRNTMTLTNAAYRRPLTWSNHRVRTLEQQTLVPLLNEHPVEMGMRGKLDLLVRRLADDPRYAAMFAVAFPSDRDPVSTRNVSRAIASFERILISGSSPYDRLVSGGDTNALTAVAWRGRQLFFSERFGCSSCHGGVDFSTPPAGSVYRNNGVGKGKFRVPTLRNVAVTAPYMHDGSIPTLDGVLDHYAPKEPAAEKADVIAFLQSLTDEQFLADPRFGPP